MQRSDHLLKNISGARGHHSQAGGVQAQTKDNAHLLLDGTGKASFFHILRRFRLIWFAFQSCSLTLARPLPTSLSYPIVHFKRQVCLGSVIYTFMYILPPLGSVGDGKDNPCAPIVEDNPAKWYESSKTSYSKFTCFLRFLFCLLQLSSHPPLNIPPTIEFQAHHERTERGRVHNCVPVRSGL